MANNYAYKMKSVLWCVLAAAGQVYLFFTKKRIAGELASINGDAIIFHVLGQNLRLQECTMLQYGVFDVTFHTKFCASMIQLSPNQAQR
ncbi:hypothetical protein GDO81_012111 [Engystomops pustulosus]|uniref:Uncharacterized protein n=1 Tax=Engystomops pustulosus TaxID=76066 RepID=A0AAV7BJ26_ENGPU|nr:hypothetical protein GDO81_012111 [Engystomops pustulosus]